MRPLEDPHQIRAAGRDYRKNDDIADSLREQLYAEEDQRLERRKKSSDSTCGLTTRYVYVEGTYLLKTSLEPPGFVKACRGLIAAPLLGCSRGA